MLTGILIIATFAAMVILMYLKRLPAIIAMPIMAILIAFWGGLNFWEISTIVIQEGSVKLSGAIITILFGGVLSEFVKESGIAETIVKKTAEFSGDNPFFVGFTLFIVTALLFTVLGGLGAVIMIGTIIIPIMLSIGIPSIVAGCLFLLGLSLGGILNLTNWQLYITILGLKQIDILKFAIPLFLSFFVVGILFFSIETKKEGEISNFSTQVTKRNFDMPYIALLTPFIPLFIILSFHIYNFIMKPFKPIEFPIVSAMLIGLFYGILTIKNYETGKINLLSKSIIEGTKNIASAIALLVGIGMILNATMHPKVSEAVLPLMSKIMPNGPISYIIFFSIMAPFSLYRGPLNIWGMGGGLIGLMLATKKLPPAAIMAAMLSVGQIQGVCDPTNTHNVWVSNFLNINVQDILKRTILYMWLVSIIGLIIGTIYYFR